MMLKSGLKRPTTPNKSKPGKPEPPPPRLVPQFTHWSQGVHETIITVQVSNEDKSPDSAVNQIFNQLVEGGSDQGLFPYLSAAIQQALPDWFHLHVSDGQDLQAGEIFLEIQGQRVAGFTQRDVVAWLSHCSRQANPVAIKTIKEEAGSLSKDLREYLHSRFQKGSIDHDLQNTIRDNLYLRTVPVTTRPPRPGEIPGVDYIFLSLEEFQELERNGSLLESGLFEGCGYGVPSPTSLPSRPRLDKRHHSCMESVVAALRMKSPLKSSTLPRAKRANKASLSTPELSIFDSEEAFKEYFLPSSITTPVRQGHEILSKSLNTLPRANPVTPFYATLRPRPLRPASSAVVLEKRHSLHDSVSSVHGHYYGTPKPTAESLSILPVTASKNPQLNSTPLSSLTNSSKVLPGAHPSSEGKRKRNRSNVEAMAAKNLLEPEEDSPPVNSNGLRARTPMAAPAHRDEGRSNPVSNLTEAELGPLPPNWEKAYTERGEVYFIDHENGTSQWLDPRLSRIQKKSLEECSDDELPYGWEKIDDPHYGTYYIDHVNRKTQYENPVLQAKRLAQGNAGSADSGTGTFPRPKKEASSSNNNGSSSPTPKRYGRPFFTRNPAELEGERICTTLLKSPRGLGFTIVGGDDAEDEFLQIKSVVPNGPAWLDAKLRTGDVLVYVNDLCVLGFTHQDMVTMFQGIAAGQAVALEVCRGYPLPFDPNDPNTEIVTTVAVSANGSENLDHYVGELITGSREDLDSPSLSRRKNISELDPTKRPGSADMLNDSHLMDQSFDPDVDDANGGNSAHPSGNGAPMPLAKPELITVHITKGAMGFGFTIADSAYGQKVKTILDRPRCQNLQEGDILVDINGINMRQLSHSEVVQVLKDCPWGREASVTVQRGGILSSPSKNKWKNANNVKKEDNLLSNTPANGNSPRKPNYPNMYRSKTPTADLYSMRPKEVVPTRPKTPLVDTRNRPKTPTHAPNNKDEYGPPPSGAPPVEFRMRSKSPGRELESDYPPSSNRSKSPGRDLDYENSGVAPSYPKYYEEDNFGNKFPNPGSFYPERNERQDYGYGYIGANGGVRYPPEEEALGQFRRQDSGYHTQPQSVANYNYNAQMQIHQFNEQQQWRQQQQQQRKESTSFEHEQPYPALKRPLAHAGPPPPPPPNGPPPGEWVEMNVTLLRHETGFGFRIVGGTEEGSQVSIGHIVPGGAADLDGRLRTGDEILSVDGHSVLHTSHHQVVQLMGAAALQGRVGIGVRRWIPFQTQLDTGFGAPELIYPYDVTVMRRENEGFGFVIISSITKGVSFIGQIIRGSPAERCERLNVGDRILAVNHHDISRLPHGDIVNLIKDSGYSVTLTVGPPLDDNSSNASNSQRSSNSSMVMAQALPLGSGNQQSTGTNGDPESGFNGIGYDVQTQSGSLDNRLLLPGTSHAHAQVEMRGRSSYYDQVDGRQEETEAVEPEDEQYYAVEVPKGLRGFGFSIRGGREFQNMPLFVLRMAETGPAYQDGRLRVGDQLIEINGMNTKNMTHAEAIEIIKNGGNVVRLLVKRGGKVPADLNENGEPMLSPIAPIGSTNAPERERPNSALSQPTFSPPGQAPPSYSTPNAPNAGLPPPPGPGPNPPSLNHPPRPLAQPRGGPNSGVPPPPFHMAPLQRALSPSGGPLSHSSPRVLTNDYYWDKYPDNRA